MGVRARDEALSVQAIKRAAIVLVVALVCVGVTAASASARPTTHVVCLNDDFHGWHEHIRPHHCNFHSKTGDANGSPCFCHADTTIMRRIRWSRWHKAFAHGRGKIGISTVGWVKARVTLWRPQWGWAPHRTLPYFTRARFQGKIRGDRFSYTLRLDVPRNGRI